MMPVDISSELISAESSRPKLHNVALECKIPDLTKDVSNKIVINTEKPPANRQKPAAKNNKSEKAKVDLPRDELNKIISNTESPPTQRKKVAAKKRKPVDLTKDVPVPKYEANKTISNTESPPTQRKKVAAKKRKPVDLTKDVPVPKYEANKTISNTESPPTQRKKVAAKKRKPVDLTKDVPVPKYEANKTISNTESPPTQRKKVAAKKRKPVDLTKDVPVPKYEANKTISNTESPPTQRKKVAAKKRKPVDLTKDVPVPKYEANKTISNTESPPTQRKKVAAKKRKPVDLTKDVPVPKYEANKTISNTESPPTQRKKVAAKKRKPVDLTKDVPVPKYEANKIVINSESSNSEIDDDSKVVPNSNQSSVKKDMVSHVDETVSSKSSQNFHNEQESAQQNNNSNTSIANYTSDETQPIEEPRAKATRKSKNWIKVYDYPTYKDAVHAIKAEEIWSICSSNSTSTTFRCNKVKCRGEQCESGLRIILSDYDLSVSLYVSRNTHNCDTLDKRATKMTDEIRNFILVQYKKGLKRKAIQDEFIKAKIPLPPQYLIENELARLRKLDNGMVTLSIAELNALLSDHRAIPDNETTAFVLDHQINDENAAEIRFNFVVSSKKLLRNNLQSNVCNADTTYKLIWQGFPVQVTGSTDGNKKFHPTCITASSHEDTDDYEFIFATLKNSTKEVLNEDLSQEILMCDAAKSISNAYRRVYGDNIMELICWFHAKSAMVEKVEELIPKELHEEIKSDIDKLQLSQNPAMFEKASKLFLSKYERFETFTEYFKHQWLTLNRNWYEGACVDIGINAPGNNNGLEVFNRTIKDEKTLRKRLPLQQFFIQLLTWIESWGNRYEAGANTISMHPMVDLPLMTLSYQWAKMNKKIKKHPDGYIMVPSGSDQDLSEWNKTLYWETFDEFRINAFKGWRTIVPEDNWMSGNCNCPVYLKDYMCKHIVGIAIRLKLVEPCFEAKQIPIGQKRKRGRPKKAKKALFKQ